MSRPWLYAGGALLAIGIAAMPARAQTFGWQPRYITNAPGSVLRLLSGVEGRAPEAPAMLDPPADEESFKGPLLPDSASAPRGDDLGTKGDPLVGGAEQDDPFPWLHGLFTPLQLRFHDIGEPLFGTSWLNRPITAGLLGGVIYTTPLIGGHVNQGAEAFGGIRFGWDFDCHWGFETRFAGARLDAHNVVQPVAPHSSSLVIWDVDLLYYPWSNTRWRPYFLLGAGVSISQFVDDNRINVHQGLFELPWGIGLKYLVREYVVARLDLVDNTAFGNGLLDTMNNVSFTAGVEVRFGGVRTHYWPWSPGRHLW